MRQVNRDSGTSFLLAIDNLEMVRRIQPWQPREPPLYGHKFSGDINGLNPLSVGLKAAFLLASIARILYPMVCLACERLRP